MVAIEAKLQITKEIYLEVEQMASYNPFQFQ